MNYLAHTAELKREQPEAPSLFARFPDSIVGHDQAIQNHGDGDSKSLG